MNPKLAHCKTMTVDDSAELFALDHKEQVISTVESYPTKKLSVAYCNLCKLVKKLGVVIKFKSRMECVSALWKLIRTNNGLTNICFGK